MKTRPGRQRTIFIAGSLFFTAAFFVTWGATQGDYRAYLPVILRRDPPPIVLITEVLYDPEGEEPGLEWVELYNPRNTALELGDYKLGDAESVGSSREGMYQFPPNATLAPQTAIVIAHNAAAFSAAYGFSPDYEFGESDPFVPSLSKYLWWASGTVNLSNAGDEILLLDGSNQVADALSWGSSSFAFDPPASKVSEGVSLERYPALQDTDTAVDWHAQDAPSPGQVDPRYPTPTPAPVAGRIYLSEVFLHPAENEPAAEWIELYNPETYTVTLAGLALGDEETPGGGEGMYRFPAGASLGPARVAVVAVQGTVFSATWGFAPDYELTDSLPAVPDLEKDTSLATGSLNLRNNGDEVLLLGWDNAVLDAISWGNSTVAFDPSLPAPDAGVSLERYPPGADTDNAADWRLQDVPDPGDVDRTPPTATPLPTSTPLPTATPTPTPTPSPADHLLISEVLYDAVTEPDGEWIELHNPTTGTIALAGYKIGDEETAGGTEGMYAFPLTATIEAGSFQVIAVDGAVFSATWGFAPDYQLSGGLEGVPDLSKYPSWGSGSVQLGNSGDEVLLLDGSDHIVDALSWGSSSVFLAPPAPDVPEGHSLERSPPWWDSDSAADWRDQALPSPGSGAWMR